MIPEKRLVKIEMRALAFRLMVRSMDYHLVAKNKMSYLKSIHRKYRIDFPKPNNDFHLKRLGVENADISTQRAALIGDEIYQKEWKDYYQKKVNKWMEKDPKTNLPRYILEFKECFREVQRLDRNTITPELEMSSWMYEFVEALKESDLSTT